MYAFVDMAMLSVLGTDVHHVLRLTAAAAPEVQAWPRFVCKEKAYL